jgi:uncharacterized damage-inducible protein DinB
VERKKGFDLYFSLSTFSLFMIEFWLRGPLTGFSPTLMPVAHALMQAKEDLMVLTSLSQDKLWAKAGSAASIGFHLNHIAGSIDRLLTYAEGKQLSSEQLAFLKQEGSSEESLEVVLARAQSKIDTALETLKSTPDSTLYEPRSVGRQNLPSTVIGLLYHIGEHTSRHVGQVMTTVRAIAGERM